MLFRKSTQPAVDNGNETDTTDDVRDGWTIHDQRSPRAHTGHVSRSQATPVLATMLRALTNRGSASQKSLRQAALPDSLLIIGAVLTGGLIMATIIYFS